MSERVKFILEWERRCEEGDGQVNMAELCRTFGVSRPCGYKWLERYRESAGDMRALDDRSRRPLSSPSAVSEDIQDLVVEARKLQPRWGPRKLRSWVVRRWPNRPWPSASAIGAILKRRGLVRPRRRRVRHGPPITAPFAEATGPNAVWCVDFKGWFRTLDREKCYPLTILDAYSRFLIRCEALLETDGDAVERVFDSAFREFGLPAALRFDGGPPFASSGPGGLTRLSVWWLRLGLILQRIAPGKPQQNGRQERMHRTLKLETEPQQDIRLQRRTFDKWRRVYNYERPHEALGQQPPAVYYRASSRHYPRPLIRPTPMDLELEVPVDKNGCIYLKRRKVFISTALSCERIGLWPLDPGLWEVSFGSIALGKLDESRLERGLIPIRHVRRTEVLTMSLG